MDNVIAENPKPMKRQPTITLEKVAPPFVQGDYFDRGERAILVDGIRWGRTHVKSHGPRGYSVFFSQAGDGDYIYRDGKERKDWNRVSVHKPRRGMFDPPGKTTEDMVFEMVQGLLQEGKLVDPATMKARNDAALAKMREEMRPAHRLAEDQEFRDKALDACGFINEPNSTESVALVARVIEAMRWAQAK